MQDTTGYYLECTAGLGQSLYECMESHHNDGGLPAVGSPAIITLKSPGAEKFFFKMPEFDKITYEIFDRKEKIYVNDRKIFKIGKIDFQKNDSGLFMPCEEVPSIERSLLCAADFMAGNYAKEFMWNKFISALE